MWAQLPWLRRPRQGVACDSRGMASDDQQRFCARWLEQRGIYGHPTLPQLMEMAEAWAAYRLRLRTRGGEPMDPPPSSSVEPDRQNRAFRPT